MLNEADTRAKLIDPSCKGRVGLNSRGFGSGVEEIVTGMQGKNRKDV